MIRLIAAIQNQHMPCFCYIQVVYFAYHALVLMLLDMNSMFYIFICGEVCACRVKAQVKL
jgi:hypothetical protein